ncbi:hypothetical protein L0Y46_04375 [bacterium]|nr:hypothetical protein [bacterium]
MRNLIRSLKKGFWVAVAIVLLWAVAEEYPASDSVGEAVGRAMEKLVHAVLGTVLDLIYQFQPILLSIAALLIALYGLKVMTAPIRRLFGGGKRRR